MIIYQNYQKSPPTLPKILRIIRQSKRKSQGITVNILSFDCHFSQLANQPIPALFFLGETNIIDVCLHAEIDQNIKEIPSEKSLYEVQPSCLTLLLPKAQEIPYIPNIQQYQLFPMKYQQQLRWLLFLLIPFTILLAIHILVPIEIISNGHSLINNDYNFDLINLSQNGVQSFSEISSMAVEGVVNRYVRIAELFHEYQGTSLSYMAVNMPLLMNSAYQIAVQYQNTLNRSSYMQQKSMWFSPGANTTSQLSPSLSDLYKKYSQKQLFIRSELSQGNQSSFISMTTLYYSSNQSLIFEYPSRFNPQYLNSSLSPLFTNILTAFSLSNLTYDFQSSVFVPAWSNDSYLAVCLGYNQQGSIEITCMQILLSHILTQLEPYFTAGQESESFTKFYLINNIQPYLVNTSNPQIIFQTNPQRNILANSSSFFQPASLGMSSDLFAIKPYDQDTEIYLSRSGTSINCVCSVGLESSQGKTALMSVLVMNQYQQFKLRVISLDNDINALIIPIVILIVIGAIVSAVFLKVLLDSIDRELFELQHRCGFIVQGDINIEIPQYNGTKDILDVYQQVKIINKLHRYTDSSYFSGHFAEKLLKYNEALQYVSNLNYDTSNILENMGQAYVHIDQWQSSISCLKKSVDMCLLEMKNKLNLTLEEAYTMKAERKSLPYGYKQLELILIRRLFKLTFTYLRFLELRQIAAKTVSKAEQAAFKEKIETLTRQWTHYLSMIKKAFFPDFWSNSECIISLIYESKQYANLKQFDEALKLIEKVKRFLRIYTDQYPEITKKLKEKGSKYKFIHQKNKLTAHSRTNPEILITMLKVNEVKILLSCRTDPEKYNVAIRLFQEGLRAGICTLSMAYLIVSDLRKFLIELKIDPQAYETTQLFKQSIPFKTLHYGEITKANEAQLLKFPTKTSQGLERQYVYLVDCSRKRERKYQKNIEYLTQRGNYIFEKLMKPTDRLSIIKYNLKSGIKIECKLTLKQSNEVVLKKEIQESFKDSSQGRGSFEEMFDALAKSINRIKSLESEKIVVMFFKSIAHYSVLSDRLKKKTMESSEGFFGRMEDSMMEREDLKVREFGEAVVELMRSPQLRNCKLILYCSCSDSVEEFRSFFGLEQVNRRIWDGYNTANNVVYVLEEKHKSDIDRILMLKAQEPANNHIFIL